jgi:crotonobetainyl-CoA:carnitine CoA-transferase CaiB-like acyl-CoA transferase
LISNGNLRTTLEEIVVVEIGDQMGDYAALLLAGLGAEVIKLEPPTGSPSRSVGPFASAARDPGESIFFWRYNLNKKSVMLHFDNPSVSRALTRILAKTDILLLAGEFPTVQHRLEQCGQIAKDNPRLIQCAITPFGLHGP